MLLLKIEKVCCFENLTIFINILLFDFNDFRLVRFYSNFSIFSVNKISSIIDKQTVHARRFFRRRHHWSPSLLRGITSHAALREG